VIPLWKQLARIAAVLVLVGALLLLFPRALAFVEMGARELRYLWWLVLMVAVALWLVFGGRRRGKAP
jgi:hypothetical protein